MQTKDLLRLEAQDAHTGILPPNTNFESQIGHTVINISSTSLTRHQVTALEKGLTFCPTPGRTDKSQIWLDFKQFHRRLELTQYFYTNQPPANDTDIDQEVIDFMDMNAGNPIEDSKNKTINQKFNPKSTWRPFPSNKTLDSFQRAFKNDLLKSNLTKKAKPNLTKEEKLGLDALKNNPEIVLKKADKGSAVVVMNTTDYLREGN